jgi:type 1 glutamine amidotransferase
MSRKTGDNALVWVQEYGKGQVFYTALGNRDEVRKDERLQ